MTTPKTRAALREAAEGAGFAMRALTENLVDALWRGRPAPPLSALAVHPIEFAGREASEKIEAYRAELGARDADFGLVSAPDALAWLLNVRGSDVPFTPLSLGYALFAADAAGPDAARLYLDARKCAPEARAHLEALGIAQRDPEALLGDLAALGGACVLDERSASVALVDALERGGGTALLGHDPCALPRATKNETELEGARRAHELDGAALVEFLAWLEARLERGEPVDEMSAAEALLGFRRARALFRDRSFPAISGFGPNGAVIHYRATPPTNLPFEGDTLYLIDSGAQYACGTTDVTRTVAVGTPSAAMRAHYTAVLRGHVALSRARFPAGTRGVQLDAITRAPLWEAGLDYAHGTGHGVGSYLAVHEGPHSISPLSVIPLEPGMIVSNEPGYYRAGSYGIRIENLIVVRPAETIENGSRAMLAFETITRAPYDRRLIEVGALTGAERSWIDDYHATVRAELAPLIAPEARAWLERATAPLDS